jgi:NADP-dependent aldehyde dehydrogenase
LRNAVTSHDLTDVDRACARAEAAFDPYRAAGLEQRAAFLDTIAEEILALGDDLLDRAGAETALPRARLEGERGRTIGQLRQFAELVRSGSWQGVRIDPALPDRKPLPRPDLRMRRIPLGPVAIFGASNFPLAFSVAGGDTASALAAGCPVVVKAHPSHPGTSELVARAVTAAVTKSRLPEGVFSMVSGPGIELGTRLVADPRMKAVGFTGSRQGGLALISVAQSRPEPIPVYAEMSSINPVLLLPAALAARAEALGQGFAASLTQGVGQFCTNPGLILGIDGPGLDRFIAAAAAALAQVPAGTMLNEGISQSYARGVSGFAAHAQVASLVAGVAESGRAAPALFAVPADDFLADPTLAHEVFGPASLIVRCAGEAVLAQVMAGLEGQLTVTLQMDAADQPLAASLLPLLERKAGRILANGWPTGVEVAPAMVHGGPFPATSDSRTTSVGTLAIDRFLRPVCYQDLPASLLPPEVRS